MSDVIILPPQRLEHRLEDNGRAWLATNSFLAQYALKERDEDQLATPEGEIPRPIIILEAKDEGRAVVNTPIRNVRLSIIVRANSKTPGGDADSFSALGGALEIFLDTTNLVQALSGPQIGVMHVARVPGLGYRSTGLVREGTVAILCKCVAAELTVGGTGVASY